MQPRTGPQRSKTKLLVNNKLKADHKDEAEEIAFNVFDNLIPHDTIHSCNSPVNQYCLYRKLWPHSINTTFVLM
ncbi:hypothetical protein CsSME_00038720 [Camellia sinensis var. sinensis]